MDAETLDWHTDSSRKFSLGFGGICNRSWFVGRWSTFVGTVKPSIEYLELYAVTVLVLLWLKIFKNRRICLFCDNMCVVHMLNSMSSYCKNCMVLIRIITLQGLLNNTRVFARHVRTQDNGPSDALL